MIKGEKMEIYEVLNNKQYRNSLGLYEKRSDAEKVAAKHMPKINDIAESHAGNNIYDCTKKSEIVSMINNAINEYEHSLPVIETRIVH